jgi:hypothetical protein
MSGGSDDLSQLVLGTLQAVADEDAVLGRIARGHRVGENFG